MDHLATKMKGPLKMFMQRFGKFVREDDYQQFFSNRRQNGRDTYLSSDFRRADKLSSIILEEYGIRNKLQGNVILVVPDPAYDVPVYMFQLGGNGKQTIALLDIAPTHPDMDYGPLIPVWEKYRKALNIGEAKIEWVLTTASPYLLHCQYGEVDTELFNEAAAAYLDVAPRALPGQGTAGDRPVSAGGKKPEGGAVALTYKGKAYKDLTYSERAAWKQENADEWAQAKAEYDRQKGG